MMVTISQPFCIDRMLFLCFGYLKMAYETKSPFWQLRCRLKFFRFAFNRLNTCMYVCMGYG